MEPVLVKFDHTLEQSEIIIPLTNSSPEEAGEHYKDNQQEVQQTSIYGIHAPLIMINNIVVDFTDVIEFELKSTSVLPTVSMVVRDRKNLIKSIDSPGIDNELRVQILPKFEDKYKKINLTFYIYYYEQDGNEITIYGEYKSPGLNSSRIKAFGKINTYNLFESIAKETSMGFATNIAPNDLDSRYVCCQNTSYLDTLALEITKSGYELQILDWWVDWWNNISLVDVYEPYNTTVPEEDIQIWVASQNHEVTEGAKIEAEQAPAILNNHPANKRTELFVEEYESTSKSNSTDGGDDNVYAIYDMEKREYMDYLISDGDKQKDIVVKFSYMGEVYGGNNYMLQTAKREKFLRKIDSNDTVKIVLNTPLLGVIRGSKVNFVWYVNDSRSQVLKENLVEGGVANQTNQTNISLDEGNVETINTAGEFIADESISGQYMVKECVIGFEDRRWRYELTLVRPTIDKPKLINDDE